MAPQTERGGGFAERFDLKDQAGAGGMGTVYRAIDRTTGVMVAVKVLHSKSRTDVGRFGQEAALLAELQHPGIVRYVDHGVTGHDEPYIAMEWLEGETLEERITRGQLSPAATCTLGYHALDALAAAHSRGIVHRDIKPSNLFLCAWDVGALRILDFGIARRVMDEKRFTEMGSTVGTPMYISPEQARGERDVDNRGDVFSLGCVLYECLAGEPAFTGNTPADVMTKICVGQPPRIGAVRPELSPELTGLIDGMLVQDRKRRTGDAAALITAFRSLAERMRNAQGGGDVDLEGAPHGRVRYETLTDIELRAMCALRVVLRKQGADVRLDEIRPAAEALGGQVDRLADHSLLISVPAHGVIRDQASLLARCALMLQQLFPEATMALGTGRASLLARLPVGQVVDNTSRLVAEAARGVIQIDEITARLLPARFEMAGSAWNRQLTGESERDDAPRSFEGKAPLPFMGRERVVATIEEILDECMGEGVARVALVLAVSGSGKTRLRQDLCARISRREGQPLLLGGTGSLVHSEAGAPLLAKVLAAARIDTGARREAMEEALITWLRSTCAKRAVVLVLENLQWADQASVRLVDAALRALGKQPFMVIAFGRPEVEDRFPALWNGRAVERLGLSPLGRRTGQKLVHHWIPNCSPDIETFVLDLWDGNPFFLEELVGAATTGIPAAPDSVLGTFEAARLHDLPPEARRTLRAGSIFLDQAFTTPMLLALLGSDKEREVGESLTLLVERDLLQRVPGGEEAFRFATRLVQEAAYRMTTASDRALGRKLAAAFLESVDKTRPDCLAVSQAGLAATDGRR